MATYGPAADPLGLPGIGARKAPETSSRPWHERSATPAQEKPKCVGTLASLAPS
jgi:hypothetical protein